jgi:cytochrome c-type biogenesis protein CcmH/NrfF
MLLAGLGIAYATTRKRATAPEAEALTDADRARLAELLKE